MTQSTTSYTRGEVVLVEFTFTDESGAKIRPAIVVSSNRYNRARREVIIAAVTSNMGRRLFGDRPIARWREAGLAFPSMATSILRTVAPAMILHRLGTLQEVDATGLQITLRQSLGL